MNVIDTSGLSREQWLALRRQSIGASDAPVIAGLSKYKSRFALWLEKTGQAEPEQAGEEAWWGTELEPLITNRLIRDQDVFNFKKQVMARHKAATLDWLTATLDLVDSGGAIWEFKAAGINTAKGLEDGNSSTLPNSWIIQAHHQMIVADVERINFAVFVGHRLQLYRFVVELDAEVAVGVFSLATEFWQHVQDRTPPAEFDASDAALLLKHYREVVGEPVVCEDPKIRHIAALYEKRKAEAEFAAEMADQCKATMLAEMANAPAMQCGPYRMRRSIVNVKEQPPKPRAAYSYVKFSFTNTESEE